MNITISSLIYSTIFAPSPFFVNKYYSFNECHLQKFSQILFYNQRILHLRKSIFSNGLNSIVYNNNVLETDEDNKHKNLFKENRSGEEGHFEQVNGEYSISIIECTFNSIQKYASIHIEGRSLSVYITQCYFYQSNPYNGFSTINLKSSRCLTFTHNCASQSKAYDDKGFLYYDCVDEDFSLFLYNSIVNTQSNEYLDNAYNIFCKNGNQYFRCNNMTTVPINTYQFDKPCCLSFAMNTVKDATQKIFHLTGYNNGQCVNAFNKELSMVNFINTGDPIFYISTICDFSITVKDSLLFSQKREIVQIGENMKNVKFIFENCVLNNVYVSEASYNSCKFENYNNLKSFMTLHPHYTYGECVGPENKGKKKAYGCNAGNCVDSNCGKTIGFPDGVIPYTTIIHIDLQTATFTPTEKFSKSAQFSKSTQFSESVKFTKLDDFLPTLNFDHTSFFTPSKSFTPSKKFIKSDEFSESSEFSNSIKFTKSETFSMSSIIA